MAAAAAQVQRLALKRREELVSSRSPGADLDPPSVGQPEEARPAANGMGVLISVTR
jgi:hypothetical protein